MSSPLRDQSAMHMPVDTPATTLANTPADTATEDPFVSPDFHLRRRSLSTSSHVSIISSPTACSLNTCSLGATTLQRRRSVWYLPSSGSYFRFRHLRAIPIRWLAILLCLVATFTIWRWCPPSQQNLALSLSDYSSTVAFQVLRPHDSTGSRPTDPERWLNENSEAALSRRNQKGWMKSPTKPKAAIISLVRNEELEGIMQSMRQLEYHWNMKYQYPWVFFNEKPFSDEFKAATSNLTSARTYYELIPVEHWSTPEWVDEDRYMNSLEYLGTIGVGKGWMLSYRNMCRWNSGFFYKHPRLKEFDYYWRVEPDVHFFCDINYDPFRFLHENKLVYGFNMNILDDARSFPSLWAKTLDFIQKYPSLLHPDADLNWLVDEHGEYNNCQFFSNFEIGSLNFFRAIENEEYFNWLDKHGGFYYERFGDAPIHTLSVAMFATKHSTWFFRDIGYQHDINRHCPPRSEDRCSCQPTKLDENFYKLVPLESPQLKPRDTCIRQWLGSGVDDQGMDWLKKKEGWTQDAERAFGGDGYGGYVVDGAY